MDKLQTLIRDVRVMIRNAQTSLDSSGSVTPIQAKVRGRVKDQLQRSDLRVAVEVSLVELLHQFDGFDMAGKEHKSQILDDSEKVLGRIESMIETDSVINADRVELPEPPAILAPLVEEQLKEERQRLAEMKAKELQKRQEQLSDNKRKQDRGQRTGGRRRPSRTRGKPSQQRSSSAPPPRKNEGSGDRNDLKFQKERSGHKPQQKRRRKPRRSGPDQKPS